MDNKEIEMWEIVICTRDGEREYNDSIYFLGSNENAIRYAESYMNDYFGEDTYWDEHDDCWYSYNDEVAADYSIRPFNTIVAMTEKGTLTYTMEFKLK